MVELARKRCVACEGGLPKVAGRELAALRRELDPGWEVERGKKLRRAFAFDDFAGALRFTDEVGASRKRSGTTPTSSSAGAASSSRSTPTRSAGSR